MKLYNRQYDLELELKENISTHLIIEDANCLKGFISGLISQTEGNEGTFSLYDGCEVFELEKILNLIINPFELDCNDRRILSKIYKEIDNIAKENYAKQLSDINARVLSLLDQCFFEVQYGMTSTDELNLQSLLKMYDVSVLTDEESLIESIIDYVRIMSEVCGYNIFIFLNINAFLPDEEMQEIISFFEYRKLYFVNISNSDYTVWDKCDKIIVDKDLCIIR